MAGAARPERCQPAVAQRQVERIVQRREPVLIAKPLERNPMLGPDVGAHAVPA